MSLGGLPRGVSIRRATPADLPAIRDLLEVLVEHQRGWRVFEPRAGFESAVMERFRGVAERPGEEDLHLVAEEAGRVVGMAFGHETTPSHFSDERAVEISSVVVHPEARGRGIGTVLVREIAAFARDLGVGRLTLHTFAPNAEALAFWESFGFAPRAVQLTARPEEIAASAPSRASGE
jgi:GNAT superfamily N-acetyltransferase